MASTQRDVICPKCGSRNIYVDKRGFDNKRAFAGGLATGDPIFALFAGNYNSNKIRLTCLNCGHTFNIEEGGRDMPSAEDYKNRYSSKGCLVILLLPLVFLSPLLWLL